MSWLAVQERFSKDTEADARPRPSFSSFVLVLRPRPSFSSFDARPRPRTTITSRTTDEQEDEEEKNSGFRRPEYLGICSRIPFEELHPIGYVVCRPCPHFYEAFFTHSALESLI